VYFALVCVCPCAAAALCIFIAWGCRGVRAGLAYGVCRCAVQANPTHTRLRRAPIPRTLQGTSVTRCVFYWLVGLSPDCNNHKIKLNARKQNTNTSTAASRTVVCVVCCVCASVDTLLALVLMAPIIKSTIIIFKLLCSDALNEKLLAGALVICSLAFRLVPCALQSFAG